MIFQSLSIFKKIRALFTYYEAHGGDCLPYSKGWISALVLTPALVSVVIISTFFCLFLFGCLTVLPPITAGTVGAGFREQFMWVVMAWLGSCRVCIPSPFAVLSFWLETLETYASRVRKHMLWFVCLVKHLLKSLCYWIRAVARSWLNLFGRSRTLQVWCTAYITVTLQSVITVLNCDRISTWFRMQNLQNGLKVKKNNKHFHAVITSCQENWFQGIILMLNYLLFKLRCSLGDYVSLEFHQAEQTNKGKKVFEFP